MNALIKTTLFNEFAINFIHMHVNLAMRYRETFDKITGSKRKRGVQIIEIIVRSTAIGLIRVYLVPSVQSAHGELDFMTCWEHVTPPMEYQIIVVVVAWFRLKRAPAGGEIRRCRHVDIDSKPRANTGL